MCVIRSQCKSDEEFISALRDEFAAKAMPENLRVLGACDFSGPKECSAEVASLSYIMADAMLAERSK